MNIGSIVFAGAVLVVGLVYEGMALGMPRGSLAYPGPGLFPVAIGAFLVATALGCLVQELLLWRSGHAAVATPLPREAPFEGGGRDVKKTVQLTALMVGYVLLLKPLGFPVAICAFLALAIRIFGYRRWLPTLAIAVLIAGLSYVSFAHWLKVPLPLGLLEELLG